MRPVLVQNQTLREIGMYISDVMHPKAVAIAPETSVQEVARLMEKNDIGAVLVMADGGLAGIVTDRDLALRVIAKGGDPKGMTAGDVMTKGVIHCAARETVEDAIHLMEQKQIRRLPVLDKAGKVVGMLSLGDVAQAMPQSLSGELLHAVAQHHA